MDIASSTHPAWGFLGRGPRALHTRNVAQVVGADCMTPSNFVLCWTQEGEVRGGTATAIRVALANRIPVFNLFNERALKAAVAYVDSGFFDTEAWRIT